MTPPPTTEPLDLAPILARADAATPGPWEADLDVFGHDSAAEIEACISAHNPETLMLFTSGTGLIHHGTDAERDAAWGLAMSGQQARDATFIAHARTDIPALAAEITRLRTALEHAITTGCAAVADALREGEEARAEATRLRAVAPRWRDAGHGEYEMVVGTCTVGAILRVGDRIRPVAATEPLGFADSLPSAARAVCGRLGLPPVLDGLPEGGVKPC